MADFIFDSFTEALGDGTFDMDDDTLKCALFTDASLPTSGEYSDYATLAGTETEVANGNGYATAGVALGSITWTQTAGSLKFDAADAEWTSATFTARWAIIYSVSATGNDLICLIDFGSDKSVSGGTFTIQFHSNGIFVLAQA